MSYSFLWTDRSRKDLEKLPSHISKRIVDKIESLSEDPHRTAERFDGYPYFHQRIGAKRAILKIDDSATNRNTSRIPMENKDHALYNLLTGTPGS